MKFMENLKKKKANNKGFSLVELIIVIAIMAILVGIVGTQVIPYLEKSRVAKDQQILSAWNTAAVSAYTMNAEEITAKTTITINEDGAITIAPTTATKTLETFKELSGLTAGYADSVFTSKVAKEANKVEVVIDPSGATVTVKCGTITVESSL